MAGIAQARGDYLQQQDIEDAKLENEGDHPYHSVEKNAEVKFDAVLKNALQKKNINSESLDWLLITKYAIFIYLVVTCFSCYYRADFLSMTVIALTIFAVELPHFFRRSTFRKLVGLCAVTFVYDFIHLFFMHDSRVDDEADGGMQRGVRTFSYFFAWISFLLRPIICIILWKDSLHFLEFIRKQDPQNTELANII